jgi:HSP20 family protein
MKSSQRPYVSSPATLLRPCSPQDLQWDMQQIQLAITRRAYELFEMRNRDHGHDWEDWFRAESELLRPVSTAISETPERFSIRANVLGFSERELKVSIEPKRIAIVGTKDFSAEAATKRAPADFYPDQILHLIPLASEIDSEGAVVELQSGVLKFELPKVAPRAKAVGTA